MQISNSSNNINFNLAQGLNTDLNPYPEKHPVRKKVFAGLIILLVLCFCSFSSIYTFISYGGLEEIQKLQNNLSGTGIIPTSTERSYHEETLSYFTQDEIKKLGILQLPENFKIQETYKGIKLVQSESQTFSDIQIKLLKNFIDLTPQRLLTPGPDAIITFKQGEIKQGPNFNTNTAAFASGSYVFFNDSSFNPTSPLADNSVDAAYSTFEHELTHVAQFREVTQDIKSDAIDKSNQQGLSWIDLVLNSNLMSDYAVSTGWEKNLDSDGKVTFTLKDPTTAKTSSYGKTKIYEDMAESVAAAITTDDKDYSVERLNWAYKFLNEGKGTLKAYKLPFSPNLEQVKASNLQYDSSKDKVYSQNYELSVKQVFLTQKLDTIDTIYDYYKTELETRGWTGKFTRNADSNNVIRYKGDFKSKYRDMYIEIYSYDLAKGYIVKPKGTIVVIVSGYVPVASGV